MGKLRSAYVGRGGRSRARVLSLFALCASALSLTLVTGLITPPAVASAVDQEAQPTDTLETGEGLDTPSLDGSDDAESPEGELEVLGEGDELQGDLLSDDALGDDAQLGGGMISPLSVPVGGGDYHMPSPDRPYLKFEINDPVTGQPIQHAGSTVTIQGARSGTNSTTAARWNNAVTVLDCVTGDEPCGANSLDQDSRPGHFAVDRLTPGETVANRLSDTSRYRIGAGPVGAAPIGYQWTTVEPPNLREDSAGVTAEIAPINMSNTTNANTAADGEWVAIPNPGGTGINMVHDFARTQANAGPPVLEEAPSISWNVTQGGTPTEGATVRLQGPRTGNSAWGAIYDVVDCTSDPCAPGSMDQDPAPGQFKVYTLRTSAGAGVALVTGTSNSRYRLLPADSSAPLGTQFANTGPMMQASPGNANSTQGTWSGSPANYNFGNIEVQTAPSLVWEVRNGGASGELVGGATVRVERPNGSSWPSGTGGTANQHRYNVVDCTSDPCAPDSMDQDPAPGKFQVFTLSGSLNGAQTHAISNTSRYRIQPQGAAPRYNEWVNTNWVESAGTFGSPTGWQANPPRYNFGLLNLQDSPSLTWQVREGNPATGPLVSGATVLVSGPRSGFLFISWGTEREVADCTSAPCGPMLDQDPTPGQFRVFEIGPGGGESDNTRVVSGSRYRIQAFSSPFGKSWVTTTDWVEGTGSGNSGTNWSNNQYAFPNLGLGDANSLKWTVQEQGTNTPVGGATVRLQVGTTGQFYYVSDCVEAPCHPESMDQDPAPGVFQVDVLRGLDGSTQTAVEVSRTSYRISPIGSLPEYQWVTPGSTWQSTPTWTSGNLQNEFVTPLWVAPRPADFNPAAFCSVPQDGRYYTLSRPGNTTASEIRILRPTFDGTGTENGIGSSAELLANSAMTTIGTTQTTNALGVTPTGVFYFTGQTATNAETRRNVTVYRFDPAFDTAPFPVTNMDLLSPTAGTIVSGDATIYNGREEFYFAYYSDSPLTVDGGEAIRFHLYRYSAGDGARTGEVRHIDVPKPSGMNNYNGDFSFTATNDLQFIISDNAGRFSSGVVLGNDFIHQPSAHVLPDVTAIVGTAVTSLAENSNLAAINGITYTKSGRAIMQRNASAGTGNNNFLGTTPNLSSIGTQQTFNVGNFVDLAGCDSPSTITIKKEVVGERYNVGDQFTLSAQRQVTGQSAEQFGSVTTDGPATGVQDDQLGPYVMTLDGTLTASETITQNDNRYESSYECSILDANGQPGVPFHTSGGFAPDDTNRTLSLDLNNRATIQPGDQVECTFKNRRYVSDLKVSKTADPETGTTVADSTDSDPSLVRYVLTFDNTGGSAPARNISYTDWLKDVFDDADPEWFTGSHRFEYRSGTSGTWNATPPAAPNRVIGDDTNIGQTAEPTISLTGQVPAGQVRQVSFLVKVKQNSADTADRLDAEAPLQGFLLRNYLTQNDSETGDPTPPPATCVIPTGPGALPLCAEHPISAWSVEKDSRPGHNSALHKGGNVHYQLIATKVNPETTLENLVFTDDLTDVFQTAGFAPDAAVPGGALSRGIYFFNAAGQTVDTSGTPTATQPQAVLAGDAGVPLPTQVGERWLLQSSPVTLPATAVRAELWFAVQAGEITSEPGNPANTYPPHAFNPTPVTGATFTNFVTANGSTAPMNCVTDVDIVGDPAFPVECQVTHRMQDNYFTIRKDASGPAVDAVNLTTNGDGQTVVADPAFGTDTSGMVDMVGHEFSVRDRTDGDPAVPDSSSRYLCRTEYNPNAPTNWDGTFSATSDAGEDWGQGSATLQAIKDWNAAHPDDRRPECALLFMQGDITNLSSPEAQDAGFQNGRWRSENLPGGEYWLIETKAPDRQINVARTATRPVPGVQLLAQPIPFVVWQDDPSTPTWGQNNSSQEGIGQLDVLAGAESGMAPGTDRPTPTIYGDRCAPGANVSERPTACVNPTGYLFLLKDTGPAPLPLSGGKMLGILTMGGATVLLLALGGVWLWRRRQAAEMSEQTTE